jgi:hypothetical protein
MMKLVGAEVEINSKLDEKIKEKRKSKRTEVGDGNGFWNNNARCGIERLVLSSWSTRWK